MTSSPSSSTRFPSQLLIFFLLLVHLFLLLSIAGSGEALRCYKAPVRAPVRHHPPQGGRTHTHTHDFAVDVSNDVEGGHGEEEEEEEGDEDEESEGAEEEENAHEEEVEVAEGKELAMPRYAATRVIHNNAPSGIGGHHLKQAECEPDEAFCAYVIDAMGLIEPDGCAQAVGKRDDVSGQ